MEPNNTIMYTIDTVIISNLYSREIVELYFAIDREKRLIGAKKKVNESLRIAVQIAQQRITLRRLLLNGK